ncbi:hypothetical protein SESBI_36766 [Sesbania bispinosa]|nr:hypothetical protein SESBI_36766 [Sesbania bispinosa]
MDDFKNYAQDDRFEFEFDTQRVVNGDDTQNQVMVVAADTLASFKEQDCNRDSRGNEGISGGVNVIDWGFSRVDEDLFGSCVNFDNHNGSCVNLHAAEECAFTGPDSRYSDCINPKRCEAFLGLGRSGAHTQIASEENSLSNIMCTTINGATELGDERRGNPTEVEVMTSEAAAATGGRASDYKPGELHCDPPPPYSRSDRYPDEPEKNAAEREVNGAENAQTKHYTGERRREERTTERCTVGDLEASWVAEMRRSGQRRTGSLERMELRLGGGAD